MGREPAHAQKGTGRGRIWFRSRARAASLRTFEARFGGNSGATAGAIWRLFPFPAYFERKRSEARWFMASGLWFILLSRFEIGQRRQKESQWKGALKAQKLEICRYFYYLSYSFHKKNLYTAYIHDPQRGLRETKQENQEKIRSHTFKIR